MAIGVEVAGAPETLVPHEDECARLRRRVQELEAELERKEQLLLAVVDHLPGSIYARDKEDILLFVNRTAAAFLHREPSECIGRPTANFFPKEVSQRWRETDSRVIATGQSVETEEMVPSEDGLRLHRSVYFPIVDRSGAVWAIGGVSLDISAERRAEDGRRRSEALLTSILTHAPMLISSTSAEGKLTSLRGKLPVTSLKPEQLIGRSMEDLTRGAPEMLELLRAAFAGHIGHAVIPINDRLYETWFLPDDHHGKDRREVVTVGIDVTEQRRAEQEQRRLAAEYIEAQQAAIRELSAPIIPITENALAVPLVGRIDDARASQIMESLLQGVAARRARIAIVDVTGVSGVDVEAASALVRVARAASLLGAQVVMTGIRPSMAQTLLETGVELGELVVLASLQDGIAYALADGRR